MILKARHVQWDLWNLHQRARGRLLVLTGARQTGKSTLAHMAFPDYPLIDMDTPAERAVYERLSPADWIARFPRAVIDEAQKLPAVFEIVKACYDRDPRVRYVLLGSSQILVQKKVRETLAGRVALRELFPFSLPELANSKPATYPRDSRLVDLVRAEAPAGAIEKLFPADLVLAPAHAAAALWWRELLRWGGMPVIHAEGWTDEDRFQWLQDYQATYLQRDLADLARLDRLEPFVRAQKAAALKTAQTINFSELARLADVSPPTARQYLRYLEISYQVVLLPAWFRNLGKRLAKQPKLHFLDSGIRRAVANRRGEPDGAEYESAVVAEVIKQCRTRRLPVEFHNLRTSDGREVDLLVEREDGFIAMECKQAERSGPSDFRHLRGLEEILDKPLLLGLVVSEDPQIERIDDAPAPLWKLPAAALLC